MMRNGILLIIVITLFGCSQSAKQETSSTETTSQEVNPLKGLIAVNLSEYGSFKDIHVPDRSGSGVDAAVSTDDLSGFITITAGKGFRILLREEPTTLEDIKQELENDLMWSSAITEVDEHGIIIERSLPDGSMNNHHFAAVLPGIGSNVVLRSDPMGEFSRKQSEKMLKCAMTLTSQEGLALTNQGKQLP